MASIKVPLKTEETSVTFIGFPSSPTELFRTFVWELAADTAPGMVSGLRGARKTELGDDLRMLVSNALNFRAVCIRDSRAYEATPFETEGYRVLETSSGFKVYPVSERRRLTTARLLGRIVQQDFSFLYEGVSRKAKVKRVFPWGIRGITERGYRNFLFDKMAVPPQTAPCSAVTIKLKCESALGSGKLHIKLEDSPAYSNPRALSEQILFKNQQIVSPDTVLRRQNHETPPGA